MAARPLPSWCASRNASRIPSACCSTCDVNVSKPPQGSRKPRHGRHLRRHRHRRRAGRLCRGDPRGAARPQDRLRREARHALAVHGVKVAGVELDLTALMARKDKVVGENTRGVEFLFRKYKVDYVKGAARFTAPGKLAVTAINGGQAQELAAKSIIIATGSDIVPLPDVEIDEKTVVSSTGALALPVVPKSMVVVGGGYIGLEMGSVWRRLGSAVTVVEFLDRITPGMDGELSRNLQRVLTKQGFAFRLGTKVVAAKRGADGVALTLEPAQGGTREEIKADVVLVAIGRRPYTEGLGLEAVGVVVDNKGRIKVDHDFATNVKSVYAIGDVIAGPMLAHKASEEGVALAEMLAGQKTHVNYEAI